MENLKIATWNIKSNSFNIRENEMKAAAIIQLLKENNLDFVSLQEVNPLLIKKIENRLKEIDSKYHVISVFDSIFDITQNLKVEYNVIITKIELNSLGAFNKVYEPFIYNLSSRPLKLFNKKIDFFERKLICQYFVDNIIFNNINFESLDKDIVYKQIQEVFCILKNQYLDGYSSVLTGNLNYELDEKNTNLKKLFSSVGMKMIIEDSEEYISIPKDWKVENVEILDNYSDISYKSPVLVKVRKN